MVRGENAIVSQRRSIFACRTWLIRSLLDCPIGSAGNLRRQPGNRRQQQVAERGPQRLDAVVHPQMAGKRAVASATFRIEQYVLFEKELERAGTRALPVARPQKCAEHAGQPSILITCDTGCPSGLIETTCQRQVILADARQAVVVGDRLEVEQPSHELVMVEALSDFGDPGPGREVVSVAFAFTQLLQL